jgi:hypothetical protein
VKAVRSSERPAIFHQSDTHQKVVLFVEFNVFWDGMVCSLVDCYRRFGATYSLSVIIVSITLHPLSFVFLFIFKCCYFFFFFTYFLL